MSLRSWYGFPLLFLCLNTPNLALAFFGVDFIHASMIKQGLYLSLCFSLCLLPLIYFKPKTYFYSFYILAPCILAECIHISLYGMPLNAGVLLSIAQTNPNEALNFLSISFKWILPSIIILGIYSYIHLKKIPKDLLKFKIKGTLLIFAFSTLSALALRDIWISHQFNPTEKWSNSAVAGLNTFQNKFLKIFPFSTLIQIKNIYAIQKEKANYLHNTQAFKFEIKSPALPENEVYVLVIGESARAQNFSLYGYNRTTNPLLSQRKDLISFQNIWSQASLTTLSVPMLLTRASSKNFALRFKEKSIISAFKEAGFKTYWISNQGLNNSELALYSSEIDQLDDLNSNIDFKGNYDEHILPLLKKDLADQYSKKFIIIHLMGSHFNYKYRYPTQWDKFQPSISDHFEYNDIQKNNRDQIINTYDNSILYTDFILNQIIEQVKYSNSISTINYISDHGENIFETNEKFGHGSIPPTTYEIKVPWIFWYSPKFEQYFPQTLQILKGHQKSFASSQMLFHTLLQQAQFQSPYIADSLSLASSRFQSPDSLYVLGSDFTVFPIAKSTLPYQK